MTGLNATLSGSGTFINTGTNFQLANNTSIASGTALVFACPINITGAFTITNRGTVTVNHATGIVGASSSSTWVNIAGSVLNIAGALLTTGTLDATAGPAFIGDIFRAGNYVIYLGGAQNIKPTTYYNLQLAGSGTKTM